MDFGATGAEKRAMALMLLSAFLYSLVPVWVGFGNAGSSPFFFTAIAHLAAIPMILFYVHRNSGWEFLNWKTVKAMFGYQPRNRIFLVYLFLLGICTTSYAFFSMASKHLEYSNLPIVAASFLTPLFALGILLFLGWFNISDWSYANIRWDYLAMGATAIFSANILLNLRADMRTGYRSLVLCLWIFGAFRYLYGGQPWPWYYESIAVVTGILAIAVGFRSERFVRRSQMEESPSIDILHSLTWRIDKYGSKAALRQRLESARGQFLSAHSPEKSILTTPMSLVCML